MRNKQEKNKWYTRYCRSMVQWTIWSECKQHALLTIRCCARWRYEWRNSIFTQI